MPVPPDRRHKRQTASADPRKVMRSPAFQRALRLARRYLNNPVHLQSLAEKAQRKAERRRGGDGQVRGVLAGVWSTLMTFFRLLKAYASGQYRDLSWDSVLLIAATIIYFVSPIDAIFDFIPGLGYLDDVALLSWCLTTVSSDLESFRAWEARQASHPNEDEQVGDDPQE